MNSNHAYRKDGRRILDPPCALGHASQAMECPACYESLHGEPAEPKWWAWFARRYRKHYARITEIKGASIHRVSEV